MTGQFAYPPDREEISAKQVAALESLLIEKGVITPQTVDKVLAYFETEMTPLNGKKIVVKAWTDPEFAAKVVVDTPAAVAELNLPDGMAGAEGEHLQAVANTSGVHNLVICTLCSCFPWPVLGLPPYWYKDPTFRSRAAREPRKVLAEVGLDLPADTEIKVWDSSGHSRWFVIPERPSGTEDFTDEMLMDLVTTEAMIGVALAGPRVMKLHETCTTDQAAPQFDHEWQRRAFGLALALSEFRHYPWSEFQETLIATIGEWEATPESERGQWEYYDHWVATLEKLVDRHELLTAPVLTDASDHALAHDHDH